VAFLPALFGHAWDLGLLAFLSGRLERLAHPKPWITATLLVTACQLAYVSAVTVIPAFLLALALSVLAFPGLERWRRSLAVLGFGVAGSLLSVLLYYRHFLGPFLDAPMTLLATPAASPGSPPTSLFAVAATVTLGSFSPLLLGLAVVGAVRVRRSRGRVLLAAWGLAYVLLILARACWPSLFQFQHEALFVAPLVFLAAGEAIAWIHSRGRFGRVGALVLALALAAEGFSRQWASVLGQLGHAR
jgi:hypothetical protein